MAVTEALSLLFAWWAAPLGRAAGLGGSANSLAMSQFNPLAFDTHGITPLGYAAFAFTLGVTAGALIRRTVPAMAVTLAIFAALQIAMPLWIRPNLVPGQPHDRRDHQRHNVEPFQNRLAAHLHLHARYGRLRRPARGLDPVQRRRGAAGHPVSTVVPSACSPAASSGGPGPALVELPDQPGHTDRRHLPARQPVLALAVDGNRHLPRPFPRPGRVLLPAAQPPLLKRPANEKRPGSLRQEAQSANLPVRTDNYPRLCRDPASSVRRFRVS